MGILTSQEIGAKLREFRKTRGLTQEQLAESIDVTFQQIQKYENGTTRLNTDKLQAIAKTLNVPISAFFDEETLEERLLSNQEMEIVKGFRAVSNSEVREFLVNCLSRSQRR